MNRKTITRVCAAFGAVFAVALAFLALKAVAPLATPIYLLASKTTLLTLAPLGGAALLATAPVAVPGAPSGNVSLESKNRVAQELRAKAQALRDEIADTSKPMTLDELKSKQDAINAYLARANAVAEFTADDEVRRQGGTDGTGIERVDNPEAGNDGRRSHKRSKMAARLDDYARRAQDAFGDVRHFMKVAAGLSPIENDTQRRLIEENKTLTRAIVGTTGDASGGEFLLPLTQVASIFSLSNVQQGLLQYARAYNVPGRTLRIPYLIQTGESANATLNRPMAGQIAAVTIVGEGSTKPTREPKFGQRLLTVYKYAAITQAGDELLGDDFTGELPEEFTNAVGQEALNQINAHITIDGSGSSEPLGALHTSANPALIKVTRNTAGDIKPADLFGMYERHTHGPNSRWFISRRTLSKLFAMSLTSASLVTFLRNLNEAPTMMILGYPVTVTDLLPTVGSESDIALINPDFYAFALRQALTVESSRDYAFVQDLTTWRYIVRAGGIPIPTGTYAYKYSGSALVDEHSPFVSLDN